MPRRGPYAKTAATREQALTAALEIIHERGLSSTSIQQVADAVGLTKPGLLHHFGSREGLLLAVIERSDQLNTFDLTEISALDALIELDEHNLDVDGLVALYLGLAGTAASERGDTVLRTFFAKRYRTVRNIYVDDIRAAQAAGTVRDDIDAEDVAAIIVAASDGLQMQALIDGSVDALRSLRALRTLLAPRP
jgi:TetR/AcrR family transcriptional regulator, transcriptional repressor of aconitase